MNGKARKIAVLAAVMTTGLTGTGVAVANAGIKWDNVSTTDTTCTTGWTPQIKSGSKGAAVENAQCLLNRHGNYKLKRTGTFDAKTKAAVQDFQKKKGLEVDGIVGPRTWAALQKPALGTVAQPKPKDDSGEVSAARKKVLKRAATWMHGSNGGPVPYSQSRYHGGYRTDCSGFASMALEYKGSPNTVLLATSKYTHKIKMSELKPGDLVIDAAGSNTTRHVVIFEKWNNKAKTSYTAYEQSGDGGTHHRTQRYGLEKGSEYSAYRPNKFKD